jgi:hypothetical protein
VNRTAKRLETAVWNGASMEPAVNDALGQGERVATEHWLPHSRTLPTRLLLLIPGGPRSMPELRDFASDVACRFAGQWERALEYVNKSNDRLVNNARGLLTFNGLVLTALGTVYRESHSIPASLALTGSVCAVVAAGMLLLTQFSVSFGDRSRYRSAEYEFPYCVTRVVINGKSNAVAALFSLVALLCLLTAFGIVVLRHHVY